MSYFRSLVADLVGNHNGIEFGPKSGYSVSLGDDKDLVITVFPHTRSLYQDAIKVTLDKSLCDSLGIVVELNYDLVLEVGPTLEDMVILKLTDDNYDYIINKYQALNKHFKDGTTRVRICVSAVRSIYYRPKLGINEAVETVHTLMQSSNY